MNASSLVVDGTSMTFRAEEKTSGVSVITTGVALWARYMATSFAASAATEPSNPAAQTRIIGSAERSMFFLSSVKSAAMDL